MAFSVENLSADNLKIVFIGRLDVDSVVKIWGDCIHAIKKGKPKILVLDFKSVDYCDGAGIALIKMIQDKQAESNAACIIDNLNPDFQKLLTYIEKQPDKISKEHLSKMNVAEYLGSLTVNAFTILRENVEFLGKLSYQMLLALIDIKKIRWRDFMRFIENTGPQALPIIILVGFLIGLISTFQAAPSFKNFGAQIYMVNLVGLGLVREMGPLLTAVLLAGRTASSFSAEIGTMKINQEVDALETMGLNPIRFLIVPRILAVMLVTPILEMFFIIFGLLGCLLVMSYLGYTSDAFFHQLRESITPIDYIGGVIKVFAFGLVISGVGCLHGIKTRFGAQAVGKSTTYAVVSSLIMLVVVDGIFALIYYVLGI